MAEAAPIEVAQFNGTDGIQRRGLIISYGVPQIIDITMPDGSPGRCVMIDPVPQIVKAKDAKGDEVLWDMANEPKPDAVGNNSRNGFLYNCYTHVLGDFFQRVIKGSILSIIHRIHNTDIPRYDKQAYVYEDPRLKTLDQIITGAVLRVVNDKDRVRKREILMNCKDICLFMLKEDVFYRPRILQAIVAASKEIMANEQLLSNLTDAEAYNLARFADGMNHKGDFSDLPEEERAKLPKNWTGLP